MFTYVIRSVGRSCLLLLMLAGAGKVFSESERKQVLATIKPVQLLVKAIGGDAVDVELLLAPGQSPHHYQLRPSDRLKLETAAQIYWVGPALETFLARSLAALPADRVQTLGAALPAGDGHDHDHDHAHESAAEQDPHLWLDYAQIVQMSAEVERALTALLPAQATRLAANRRHFLQQLGEADRRAKADLQPLVGRTLLMSHAAYGRLLAHFALPDGMALSDAHGRSAGARHWQQIDEFVARQAPRCLLVDPSEPNALQDSFLRRHGLPVVAADVMGVDVANDSEGFVQLYAGLAASLRQCLSAAGVSEEGR